MYKAELPKEREKELEGEREKERKEEGREEQRTGRREGEQKTFYLLLYSLNCCSDSWARLKPAFLLLSLAH